MRFHADYFGFGYGVFCCHAGEHLNKVIKTSEITDTNLDKKRFHKIIHLMRVKQLVFTDIILRKPPSIKCGACSEVGHNRKNKICRLHPIHPKVDLTEEQI